MKNLSLLFLLSLSIQSFANEECISEYRKSFFTKNAKYDKARERHSNQVKRWRDRTLALASYGAQLTNDPYPTSPKKSEFKMFEEDIIKSYEFELTQNIGQKPKLLEEIYLKASLIDPEITYQSVQDEIIKGIDTSEFCEKKLFIFNSLSKSKKVEKYVLSNLRKKYSNEDSQLRINDSTIARDEFSTETSGTLSNSNSATEQ